MILETAILNVKPSLKGRFEADFGKAGQYISVTKGYIKHSLSKCVERPDKYLLLVEWETLEDHTIGFRESPQYLEWKQLLHHYYDPFPIVEHYSTIIEHKG
ncbi:MAG: antibiotic biosynthesis monooxygenase [Parapedobacter sp.]|nr:MAG: antibiotic biosynthesis monooxygenase [Parapedobacter sp.]